MNKAWLVIMVLAGGIFLWFLSQASYDLWNYVRLSKRTPCKVQEWSVLEQSASKFALTADYRYSVNHKEYVGKTIFKQNTFLNHIAAEQAIKKWKQESWLAWYDHRHPEFSSLQKLFPIKHLVHTLLSMGVFIYFYVLRYFAKRLPA